MGSASRRDWSGESGKAVAAVLGFAAALFLPVPSPAGDEIDRLREQILVGRFAEVEERAKALLAEAEARDGPDERVL